MLGFGHTCNFSDNKLSISWGFDLFGHGYWFCCSIK